MNYAYACPHCGPFDSTISGNTIQCRCGRTAKRQFRVQFNRSSLKQQGRWDPVVGEYVANDREFRNALARGQAREEAELGMEVKLVQVDGRDKEALATLHGQTMEQREADLEGTRKAEFERAKA